MSFLDTIENDPPVSQPVAFYFTTTAGQTTFSGADRRGLPLNYTPGYGSLFVMLDGAFLSSGDDYTATDGASIVLAKPCDPQSEFVAISFNAFTPANVYTQAQSDAQYSRRRNRIIDPGMRVSQENGSNLLTLANGVGVYPSDSWIAYRSGSTGGATAQRVASPTLSGNPYRLRLTVTAASAAPAAGDSLQLVTRIEGIDVADLRFGSSAARTVTVRFGCRCSVAGTYGIALGNTYLTRMNPSTFTIAPAEVGLDVVKTVTFNGDQTGAWATDNTIGLQLLFGLMVGSTSQGPTGWGSGQYLSPAGVTNLMATNGATFDLFDVGLYDVTGLQNGVIPLFELDSYTLDLLKCYRYFETDYEVIQQGGVGALIIPIQFKMAKRTQPSISYSSVSYGASSGLTTNYIGGNSFGPQIQTSNQSGYAAFIWTANARL